MTTTTLRTDELDTILAKLERLYTPDELAYIARHLGQPYYRDGEVLLGHKNTADAKRYEEEQAGGLVYLASRTLQAR